MKYLGIDLGAKTIGVAISNSGIIASTLTTLRFKEDDYDEAAKLLLPLIIENKIDVLVIGLPKHMNNDVGIRGQISIDFKAKMASLTNIEIILSDERLTTKMAVKALSDSKKKGKAQKALKDELAAQLILQNYLDMERG